MTEDELILQTARAIIAHCDGNPIQVQYDGKGDWDDWRIPDRPSARSKSNYRPKPEPVTRPWSGPDDVPLNCWLRRQNDWHALVVMVNGSRIAACIGVSDKLHDIPYTALGNYEYSTDRREWKKCEVTEP